MSSAIIDQASSQTPRKHNFKTVLGFGIALKPIDPSNVPPHLTRTSVDTARSYRQKRKQRADRSSITDPAFYSPDMKRTPLGANNNNIRPLRRRVNAQDGPWSVSVAETPHDVWSYSIYIKTPTHNLTLTRTAMELVHLHHKLAELIPAADFPAIPIDVNSLPPPPPKRKSTFLNTLSRIASPTSARSARHARLTTTYVLPPNHTIITTTPLASPSSETLDPFIHVETIAAPPPTSTSTADSSNGSTSSSPPPSAATGLAAYLTNISNMPGVRQARVWKRFVRVRTDDLESVRAERAIKRLRSDIAAHVSSSATKPAALESHADVGANGHADAGPGPEEEEQSSASLPPPTTNGVVAETEEEISAALKEDAAIARAVVEDLSFDDVEPDSAAVNTSASATGAPTPPSPSPGAAEPVINGVKEVGEEAEEIEEEEEEKQVEEASLAAATDEVPVGRTQRSQSADPDEARRLSRVCTSSTTRTQTEEDQASISTSEKRRSGGRTKRSKSVDPNSKKKSQRKVVIDDFEMMRVLGKGCAGKVLLVRHKSTADLYALKAITKRHVLAHQELQHTLTEQAVLKRMAAEAKDPFVVKLWWSFHDKENLFLVMDFHPGGDLATQLARWGRLGRDRARFYAAEIVEGVEGLHAAGVIYRDLKPENILIGADGHIVLTDFGLSKEFPRQGAPASGFRSEFYSVPGTPQTPPWAAAAAAGAAAEAWPGRVGPPNESTSTFCGTAEYLAPEVIQGMPYSFEVDWWSFGTMLYEMLTGITPFWANNHSDMYVRVLQDELQFPDDRGMDQDTKSLIRGLLQRNPALRMCEPRIKRHPYFSMIDWSHVYYKRYIPPYIPPIDPHNASDTQNFDDTFLDMEPVLDDQTDTDAEREQTDTDRTDGDETNTTPSQSRSSSVQPGTQQQQLQQLQQQQQQLQLQQQQEDDSVDVFDGYSFKGRHSVLIDGEEEEESEEEEAGEEEEEEEEGGVVDSRDDLGGLVEAAVGGDLEGEAGEPKTPEARRSVLLPEPEPEVEVEPAAEPPLPVETPGVDVVEDDSFEVEVMEVPRRSVELARGETATPVPEEPPATTTRLEKSKSAAAAENGGGRLTVGSNTKTRVRREKSGVPALDRYLSDTIDEDATEREEEEEEEGDDGWDIVEAGDGEEQNEYRGTTSLFARGVVDRYRLAVFRKVSTPSRRPGTVRSASGMSKESEVTTTTTTTTDAAVESPSPPEKKRRRGRNPGLKFSRKGPRPFLRAKSPAPALPSSPSVSWKGTNANVDGHGVSPSLKSKESAVSVGGRTTTSDQSGNGDASASAAVVHEPQGRAAQAPADTVVRSSPPEETEKRKAKKLKKYKENAEKMFSLFGGSPRQPS